MTRINDRLDEILHRAVSEALTINDEEKDEETEIGIPTKVVIVAEVQGLDGAPYLFSAYASMQTWDGIGLLEAEIERIKTNLRTGWIMHQMDDDDSPY